MSQALASIKDVYGIRRLSFDHGARTLRVEYDATRLRPAEVEAALTGAGIAVQAE